MPHDIHAWDEAEACIFPNSLQVGILDDGKPTAKTSQIVGFAGSHKGYGVIGYFRAEGGNGNMTVTGIEEVTMDFIGAKDQMVMQTNVSDFFQFLPGINSSHRVMRIAEDEYLRLLGNPAVRQQVKFLLARAFL